MTPFKCTEYDKGNGIKFDPTGKRPIQTLLKETEDVRGKTSRMHGLKDFIWETILPKVIYRVNAIPIKISMTGFCRKRKTHSKIHIEFWGSPKTILKKNKGGGRTRPDFKTYNKVTIIKIVGVCIIAVIDQWSGISALFQA